VLAGVNQDSGKIRIGQQGIQQRRYFHEIGPGAGD
jgi:hypothetical protein